MIAVFNIDRKNISVAYSPDGSNIGPEHVVTRPTNFIEGVTLLADTIMAISGGRGLRTVVGGVMSSLDRSKRTIIMPTRLSGWENGLLARELESRLRVPVRLEQSVALAGLAEATHTAGTKAPIIAYIAVDEGVEGARIVHGAIDKHSQGFHPGHQIIDAGGLSCVTCGQNGDLEAYVGSAAMRRRYGVPSSAVIDVTAWDDQAQRLSHGLTNVLVFWSPDQLVLGGSLLGPNAISLDTVSSHLQKNFHRGLQLPGVRAARYGSNGPLYGGLVLVKQL